MEGEGVNILESIHDLELKEYFLLNRYQIEKDISRNKKLCRILLNNWDEMQKRVKKHLKRKYHGK